MGKTEYQRVYWVWAAMRQRCENPSNPAYDRYGGRGITCCERWHRFPLFLEDMGPRPTPQHTLERLNNDKGYAPDNCIWATRREQSLNKREYKSTRITPGVTAEQGGFRARVRDRGVIVLSRRTKDLFEACCLAISTRNKIRGLN